MDRRPGIGTYMYWNYLANEKNVFLGTNVKIMHKYVNSQIKVQNFLEIEKCQECGDYKASPMYM